MEQVAHWPEQHLPFLHTLPHVPQLKSFVLGSKHFPVHSIAPTLQTHWPTAHTPNKHSGLVQQPVEPVHMGKPPSGQQAFCSGRQTVVPEGQVPGAHFVQSQVLSLRAFPLASKSKPNAIAAAKTPTRIMPSGLRGIGASHRDCTAYSC
jgi:hypothetical protein